MPHHVSGAGSLGTPDSLALAGTTQRRHVLGRLMYSPSQTARALRRIVAVVAIAVGLLHLKAPIGSLVAETLYQRDILQGYLLARAIVDGIDPYVPVPELGARYLGAVAGENLPHPTPHPPTLGLLLLPLAWFTFPTVAVGWLVFEMICLVASVCLIADALQARMSIWQTVGICAALLIWYPFWVELTWGQLQLPMLALLTGAWAALRRRRPVLGGAFVGLAMLLKPIVWPMMLWLLLRKEWRALLGSLAVLLGGYSVAVAVLGLSTVLTYITVVLPTVSDYYRTAWANISISSLAWRLFDGTGTGALAVAPPVLKWSAAARLSSIALPCLLVLFASLIVWRQRDLDISWGVMAAVSILVVPIAWPAYLVLTAIPAAQVIRWLACHHFPSRETNRALVATILLVVDWQMVGRLLIPAATAAFGGTLPRVAVAVLPLVPMMTTAAVLVLGWLVASLGPADVCKPQMGSTAFANTGK